MAGRRNAISRRATVAVLACLTALALGATGLAVADSESAHAPAVTRAKRIAVSPPAAPHRSSGAGGPADTTRGAADSRSTLFGWGGIPVRPPHAALDSPTALDGGGAAECGQPYDFAAGYSALPSLERMTAKELKPPKKYSKPGGSERSLEWFSDHLGTYGWRAAAFRVDSIRTESIWTYSVDPQAGADYGDSDEDLMATALVLLAYTGSGFDHRFGEFMGDCHSALIRIRQAMHPDGSARDGDVTCMRTHALVTAALSETYGLSMDKAIKPMAEITCAYLLSKQLPGGGWGLTADDRKTDLLTTALAVHALKMACISGVRESVAEARGGVRSELLAGKQQSRRDCLHAAAWLLCACFMELDLWNSAHAEELLEWLRDSSNTPDSIARSGGFLALWLASMVIYQEGGKPARAWLDAMAGYLLGRQRGWTPEDKERGWTTTAIDEYGSWDPLGPGGRVVSTAFAALALETHFRYVRSYDG